jgi:hypothetical protein
MSLLRREREARLSSAAPVSRRGRGEMWIESRKIVGPLVTTGVSCSRAVIATDESTASLAGCRRLGDQHGISPDVDVSLASADGGPSSRVRSATMSASASAMRHSVHRRLAPLRLRSRVVRRERDPVSAGAEIPARAAAERERRFRQCLPPARPPAHDPHPQQSSDPLGCVTALALRRAGPRAVRCRLHCSGRPRGRRRS